MYNYNFQQYPQYQKQSYGDEIKVVNGIDSARAYTMPPNSRVILMDNLQDRFYIKETDISGMATIAAYDFTPVVEQTPQTDYITREEVERMLKDYELNLKQEKSKSNNTAKF